jgi:AcrR family transcriptional regulator
MRRSFQRARRPEEKEVRRQAILKAARRLMDDVGSLELSLSELARRSGVSKPNIYRYFESREEILLQLWIEEVRELTGRLEVSLAAAPVGDVSAAAQAIVEAFVSRPLLCELMSIVSAVLERNLSAEAILAAKRTLLGLTLKVAERLHGLLPSIGLEDCGWAVSTVGVYASGLWPLAHPGPTAQKVLAQAEFARLQPVYERDFRRFLEVLFTGLAAKAR